MFYHQKVLQLFLFTEQLFLYHQKVLQFYLYLLLCSCTFSSTFSFLQVGTSPSAAASSVFSGSTKIVGATTVAITKSLSVIVGTTFSGSLTDDILRLLLISVLSKSTTISLGIFSAGHFNSTFLLTIFKTPPFFNPGDLSD